MAGKLSLSILSLLMVFCQPILYAQKLHPKLQDLSSLQGKWQRTNSQNPYFEEWKVASSNLLIGKSYRINSSGDTTIFERIELRQKANAVFYIPTTSDQNDGKPVEFKLVSTKENTFKFENKAHDFPQQIVYKLTDKNNLLIWIEGSTNGKHKKTRFIFKRADSIYP